MGYRDAEELAEAHNREDAEEVDWKVRAERAEVERDAGLRDLNRLAKETTAQRVRAERAEGLLREALAVMVAEWGDVSQGGEIEGGHTASRPCCQSYFEHKPTCLITRITAELEGKG